MAVADTAAAAAITSATHTTYYTSASAIHCATAAAAAATASGGAAVEPRCLQSSCRQQVAQGRSLCSNVAQLISYFLQLLQSFSNLS